ncbi:Hypothetical predicted protein [Olea europaea subsp. europaea]|uniref:Uncharacterized protein n=1 Tax=Olea europaea subsp. europaea TaxID=158383 RepID=A0A8S0TGU3_OLEEU|nr:Hypothetical predicted protein [Olea europaea subsp. europaea]
MIPHLVAYTMDPYVSSMGDNVHFSTSNAPFSMTQALARKNTQWNPHVKQIFIVACETQKHKRLRELLNSTCVKYIDAASNEWWERKIKENKDYREFRDKDCRQVYNYKDTHPLDEEGSRSSDEGERTNPAVSSMDVLRPRSGNKCTSGSKNKKDKRAKISALDLSNSVIRATSTSGKVAAKINSLVGVDVPDVNTLMKELLLTDRLNKKTDMYF